MNLPDWLANRWIVAHNASTVEVAALFAVVDRDLSLRDSIGLGRPDVDLLDLTRRKRNQAHYEQVGMASDAEANELLGVATALRATVVRWLRKNHPAMAPPGIKP